MESSAMEHHPTRRRVRGAATPSLWLRRPCRTSAEPMRQGALDPPTFRTRKMIIPKNLRNLLYYDLVELVFGAVYRIFSRKKNPN